MTRPLMWMKAVRDHPHRPAQTQVCVLVMLALRMDWSTGTGSASAAQLADDADCRERTVRSATSWARGEELLVRTRRGHRLGDGSTRASEWQLTLPVSTGTSMPVEQVSTGTNGNLNRQKPPSQPARGDAPSRTRSSRPRTSARGDGANAPRPPREPQTRHSAPPCPECGKPFSQEQLSDPEFRHLALAGCVLCSDECQAADHARHLALTGSTS